MAQITKLFTKGLDTDTAPHLQEKESYSSAMNVHFSLGSLLGPSDGQTSDEEFYNTLGNVGVLEPFAGNTDWTSLFEDINLIGYDEQGAKCIGYAVDDSETTSTNTRFFYMFIYTPAFSPYTENSWIAKVAIKYDSTNKLNTIDPTNSSVLLSGTWVLGPSSDNLAFQPEYFISARVSGNQLIWTDGVNPVRYVDINKDYFTNNPTLEELTLITEPGHVPLTSLRDNSATNPIIIQKSNYQFTYRITNEDNFTSVLAPYSLTSLSARQEEITALSYSSNIVTIDLDKAQKIPNNWKKIEFVAINLETQQYQVIRVFDKYDQTLRFYPNLGVSGVFLTDALLVEAHNDPILIKYYVSYPNWDGTNIQYTLSSTEASKQFDSVPITSKALELAANRLFLANNLEGYNTPATAPDIPVDTTTGLYTAPTSGFVSWGSSPSGSSGVISGGTPCLITIRNNGTATNNYFSCIITRDYVNGINYGFPVECGTINFDTSAFPPNGVYTTRTDIPGYSGNFLELPKLISEKSLIRLNESGDPMLEEVVLVSSPTTRQIRLNILKELNSYASGVVLGSTINAEYSFPLIGPVGVDYCNVLTASAYEAASNKQRAFFPNSSYEYGIDYYDEALRKSGVKKINTFNVPAYNPLNKQLLEKVIFNTTNTQVTGVIPNWAKYYSICVAKNSKASNFISFMPDMMRFAYKNSDGVLVYDQNEASTKLEYYGLAIPLTSLYKDGLGYSYAAGDLCELNVVDSLGVAQTYTYPVLNAIDGYVILGADRTTMINYTSYQGNQITIAYNSGSGAGHFTYPNRRFQKNIFVTIYTPALTAPSEYEVAMFGEITSSTTFGAPFNINELFGDTYTQSRDAEGGSQMMVSKARYEINQINWIHDFGRIAPIDNIGQKQLTNSIRWSNVKLPNSNVNGLSSFDALDETSVDQSSGPITTIFLSSKEANQGGRMLVLCNSGSYIALIGQQQIYSADQTPALTSSAGVLGTILPLTNLWGCISPQSVVGYKGIVFWADALNREIIQFAGDGASPISQQKAGFLWNQVFRNLPFDDSANSAVNIKCGINPYTFELFVTCPNPGLSPKQYPGNCGDNRINQYVGDKSVSYVYNWQSNSWQGAYEDNPDQWIRVGDDVFTVGSQYTPSLGLKLLKEFDNKTGQFNQLGVNTGWVTVPFASEYPATIEPLALILMGQPTTLSSIVYARDNSTNVNNNLTQVTKILNSNFDMREGEMFSSVYRNRLSNNATTNTEYDTQNLLGDRIRSKTIWAQINLQTGDQISLQGIRLEVKQSSGH